MPIDDRLNEQMHYYDRRAPEYEDIYYRPDGERQRELVRVTGDLLSCVTDRSVLEIACGTGYWTERMSQVAKSVRAFDASDTMLSIAKSKPVRENTVEFSRGDAFNLDTVVGDVDCAVANFWLSHVPKSRMNSFLEGLHQRVGVGGVVFMVDNCSLPGQGGELVRHAGIADEFRRRPLADGAQHDIFKNYYTESDLADIFTRAANGFHVVQGCYYWWLHYIVGAGGE